MKLAHSTQHRIQLLAQAALALLANALGGKGFVYLDGRDAYVVVILTEWAPEVTEGRQETIARISRAVYEFMRGSAK